MARTRTTSPSPTPPGRFRRIVGRVFKYGLIASLLAMIGVTVAVGMAASNLPSFEDMRQTTNAQTIRVRDVNGALIVSIGPNYGRWLALRDTPQVMQDAMVSVEDRRFRYHFGIDPIGLARSVKLAFVRRGSGRRLQGASTITQQLARNVFLTNNYSLARKAREAILAMAMEWKFSKDEILELYLNKVYFGGGSYGIDAASRRFFGHGADQLSLSEAAVIAGLVKAPSRYSPTADADAALGRANVVLDVMVDAGTITPQERRRARPAEIGMAIEENQNSARYFTDWALPQLDSLIDEPNEPLDVWTTLDLGLQRSATASIQANTPGGAQGALLSLDRDGAVRAMVGGRDYVTSNYNRATTAERQPGSSWKLFVYMAALESGYRIDDRVVDEPITIDGWSPRNSNGRFSGEMDLRTAFAYSVNTVAARLGDGIGFSTVANMARRFGITSDLNTHPSMVLGTADVRLIDMTAAFAAVSAQGHAVHPYGIIKVTTADGRLLFERRPEPDTVLVDAWVAAGMTDLLQTAVNTGTGRAAQIGRPVAGKTGTTSSNKDGWFLGFSSGITTGVWMGRDDARAVAGLQGGAAPARAFAAYMRAAVAERPIEQFRTEVELPQWQLEGDDEAYYGEPVTGGVDENGLPVEPEPGAPGKPDGDVEQGDSPGKPGDGQQLDQQWIDQVTGRRDGSGAVAPPAPRRNFD
ncbi:MAG: PBP1A family penicillin-binding protein [Pseudomonadota bacterium]